jgi:hypothetical protein
MKHQAVGNASWNPGGVHLAQLCLLTKRLIRAIKELSSCDPSATFENNPAI